MPDSPWLPGQRVTINRGTPTTIDRVTPGGRAIVGGRTFEPSGMERTGGDPWRRARLEMLTPEVEAEMEFAIRARASARVASDAVEAADKWVRKALGGPAHREFDPVDVARGERLTTAILQVLMERAG